MQFPICERDFRSKLRTGRRWGKTKALFIFCCGEKSAWYCFMDFVFLFYVICVQYVHEVNDWFYFYGDKI